MNTFNTKRNVNFFIPFFVFFISNTALGQQFNTTWDLLLQNKRSEALETISKEKNNTTLHYLIVQQIVKEDNGILIPDNNFINRLLSFEDYQYYIYALWDESFVFSDYVSSGFNSYNEKAIKEAFKVPYTNTSIKNSMVYLNAILNRHYKNWESYKLLLNEIPFIKNWEFTGLFENLNNSGLTISYEPETNPSNKAIFQYSKLWIGTLVHPFNTTRTLSFLLKS